MTPFVQSAWAISAKWHKVVLTKNRSFVVGVNGQAIMGNWGTMANFIKGFDYE